MVLLLLAPALAGDCEVVPLEVVGSLPDDDAVSVPLDARVIAILGDGNGDPDDWTMWLRPPDDSEVAGTTESWCHTDGGPDERRCWLTLTPDEPLLPDTVYDILIEADEDAGVRDELVWHQITTGSGSAPTVEGQPRVDVLDARDLETDCGWEAGRRWELTVQAASADLYGLSLLHVYRVEEGQTTAHGATRPVSPSGGLVSVEVARDIDDPWTGCFVAIQEDNFGDRSVASDIACYEPPLPDDGGPSGEVDVGGCAATPRPHGGGGWIGLVGLIGLASRRRGLLSRPSPAPWPRP